MRHTGEDAAHTPDTASAEPVVRVRPAWTALLSLATLAVFMAVMTPIQILLPLQLEHIDPAWKHTALSWVTGAGALVAMVANPLADALSDRTASRFGVVTLLGGLLIARCAGSVRALATSRRPVVRGPGRIVGPDRRAGSIEAFDQAIGMRSWTRPARRRDDRGRDPRRHGRAAVGRIRGCPEESPC